MEKEKLKIGITQGDINGIGYEVILKAFSDSRVLEIFTPIIYGSSKVAGYYKKALELPNVNFNIILNADQVHTKRINLINCTDEDVKIEVGRSTPEAGKAAFAALDRATYDLENGKIDALVTAPINKNNIQSDNFSFPGHTEYLEEKFGAESSSLMMLVSDYLRVAVVTGHIPLKDVSSAITKDLIIKKLSILNDSLKKDFTLVRPRIAVLGLNPHAGDNGLIGSEEEEVIIPAINESFDNGILCFGPYAADGFFGSDKFMKFDGVLAMYHDQGLIPFKSMAMDNGVNFTAGLPIIRTSPDHGTAYDIAGKNQASELSLLQAIYLACDIHKNRAFHEEINANPLPITEAKRDTRKIE
ncbi:MAG: 4-hydroxythreonine-4-phosphate dehydrogenase PdxA [Porphyromonadaceae bacterium]|nr:4-hydroxythreonine-4-phosphate dehydrogenase PdxA [Porphyromonadaceae bacterium]